MNYFVPICISVASALSLIWVIFSLNRGYFHLNMRRVSKKNNPWSFYTVLLVFTIVCVYLTIVLFL
jgi:hypothetical protein